MMPCQQLDSFQFIRLENAEVVVLNFFPTPHVGKKFPAKMT